MAGLTSPEDATVDAGGGVTAATACFFGFLATAGYRNGNNTTKLKKNCEKESRNEDIYIYGSSCNTYLNSETFVNCLRGSIR